MSGKAVALDVMGQAPQGSMPCREPGGRWLFRIRQDGDRWLVAHAGVTTTGEFQDLPAALAFAKARCGAAAATIELRIGRFFALVHQRPG